MATIAPRPITRGRSIVGEVLFWLALAVAFIFFMFPLFWLLVTSLKQRSEVTLLPPGAFADWMRAQGKLGGQHKVPRVLADPARFAAAEAGLSPGG